jgi:hypothetical protein
MLVDDALRVWLLEVNHGPSLRFDTPVDEVSNLGLKFYF